VESRFAFNASVWRSRPEIDGQNIGPAGLVGEVERLVEVLCCCLRLAEVVFGVAEAAEGVGDADL
jgi:hypothetical protein